MFGDLLVTLRPGLVRRPDPFISTSVSAMNRTQRRRWRSLLHPRYIDVIFSLA
jgi:hypothetical protein